MKWLKCYLRNRLILDFLLRCSSGVCHFWNEICRLLNCLTDLEKWDSEGKQIILGITSHWSKINCIEFHLSTFFHTSHHYLLADCSKKGRMFLLGRSKIFLRSLSFAWRKKLSQIMQLHKKGHAINLSWLCVCGCRNFLDSWAVKLLSSRLHL